MQVSIFEMTSFTGAVYPNRSLEILSNVTSGVTASNQIIYPKELFKLEMDERLKSGLFVTIKAFKHKDYI